MTEYVAAGPLNIDDARTHIGHAVVYRAHHGPVEQGVITSVGGTYVFVRYGADSHSKATLPAQLDLLVAVSPPVTQGSS